MASSGPSDGSRGGSQPGEQPVLNGAFLSPPPMDPNQPPAGTVPSRPHVPIPDVPSSLGLLSATAVVPVDPSRFSTEDSAGPIYLSSQTSNDDDLWKVTHTQSPYCDSSIISPRVLPIRTPWRAPLADSSAALSSCRRGGIICVCECVFSNFLASLSSFLCRFGLTNPPRSKG